MALSDLDFLAVFSFLGTLVCLVVAALLLASGSTVTGVLALGSGLFLFVKFLK